MLKPLHNRVLIKRVASPEMTSGGIIVPEIAKKKMNFGTVTAVGPGNLRRVNSGVGRIPPEVIEGDRIVFGKYAGAEFQMDGETFLMLREEEIMGVIED